ncbi:substrate-binding domain-containing protein [Haloplanus natans]|uniref:substrate-binding domain-containing protein n=1 Tax=Haloplanus natans TaxID=376171 RepID=UPI000A03CB61|nr:substrate-binding domain-containing protein [Haloplanus natans]
MSRDSDVSRRTVIKTTGAVGAFGVSLAGCSGGGGGGTDTGSDGSGGGSTDTSSGGSEAELTLTIGGVMTKPGSAWEGAQPSGHWEFEKRVEERTGGRIQVENVAEGQLCGELTCPDKVRQGAVEIGSASIGNSTKFYPMNDIWMLPFTFPSPQSLGYVHQKPETWEQWWVPFAQEFGVVPLWMHAPTLRSINIGLDRSNSRDSAHRLPADVKGMDCRRTGSQVSGICLNEWGMSPVSVSWADSLQGLRTGVVGGMEAAISPICAYQGNMADSLGESVHNQWTIHNDVKWASVEWLKGLSEENRAIIAEESRRIYRDLVRMNPEIHQQRLGTHTDDPPESACVNEHDLQVNYIEGDEQRQWMDMVSYEQNADLYSDIIGSADQIGVDGEAFHEYLHDSARESAVPDGFWGDDYTVDAWWDDYLEEM